MTDPVYCSVTSDEGSATVSLAGSLDLAGCPPVQEQLFTLVRDPAIDRVHLDLSGVTFIDSTGLAMLVRLARFALREGVEFGVIALSSRVDTEFARVRLSSLLVQPQADEPGP